MSSATPTAPTLVPTESAKTVKTVPAASNVAMAKRLKEIARHLNRDSIQYRNDIYVQELRRQQAQSPDSPGPRYHFMLSTQLLRAGQSEEALRELERAVAAVRDMGRNLSDNDRRANDEQRGLINLRIGEQQNCIQNHTVDSCLVPIRGQGVHKDQRGSRAAIEIYGKLLQDFPDDLRYLWLLNLAYMTVGEYPDGVPEKWLLPPAIFDSDYQVARFLDVAVPVGVEHPALSGGIVMEDFNNDGWLDLVTSSWGVLDQMRYFQNDGQGRFTDRTTEAGLIGLVGGLNMVHADYDNDGLPDILVLRGAWLGEAGEYPNSLLRNLGDGTFEDVTERAGLLSFHPTQAAAWGDYDNDGWLDLFIGNESRKKNRKCALYRNNGDGTFTDIAEKVGLDHVGFVKAAVWGDYDNDGSIDLFLSQMFQPNVLFHNDGPRLGPDADVTERALSWQFTDVTLAAGVAEPLRSFPAWFFDYDNDGWLDLMVASFADFGGSALESVVADYLKRSGQAGRCRLYHNERDGTFKDVTKAMNVNRALLAMGSNFGDIDNDGFLDMYFGTGEPRMSTLVPNVMFRNAAGTVFQDVTTAGGFGHIQKGHGVAFGDIDNDGDQDIYVVMGGAYSGDVYQNVLFENPGTPGQHWLTLQFVGTTANRKGQGARVRLVVEDPEGGRREIHRVVGTGGSFGSSSLQLEIGLGRTRRIVSLDVRWPSSGPPSRFSDVPLDRVLQVREGATALQELKPPKFRLARDPGDHEHRRGGGVAEME